MFTASLKIKDGMGAWARSLGGVLRRKDRAAEKTAAAEPGARPEPVTEGERSLHQAMGWKADAWAE